MVNTKIAQKDVIFAYIRCMYVLCCGLTLIQGIVKILFLIEYPNPNVSGVSFEDGMGNAYVSLAWEVRYCSIHFLCLCVCFK